MTEDVHLCETCKWWDYLTDTCHFQPFMTQTGKLRFPKIASKVHKCGKYENNPKRK